MSNESQTQSLVFGLPWPELNDGLHDNDVVPPSDSNCFKQAFWSSSFAWWSFPATNCFETALLVCKEAKLFSNKSRIASCSRASSRKGYIRLHVADRIYSRILLCAKTKAAKIALQHILLMGHLLLELTVKKSNLARIVFSSQYFKARPLKKEILKCKGIDRKAERGGTRQISKIYQALLTGILGEDKLYFSWHKDFASSENCFCITGCYQSANWNCVIFWGGQRTICCFTLRLRLNQDGLTIHLSFIGHPLLGDPLYIAGGQPRWFESELVDENYAQDGGY
ncbi:hypothetical protein CRYUN_Cryun01aG0058600 [Craigia yunnanensis]